MIEMAPSTLAQWFAAVGTIAAVAVALFKDSIRARLLKPKLDPTSGKETPWTGRVLLAVSGYSEGHPTPVVWTGDCYFVRVKVRNSGRTRAEKVQVYAAKLSKRGLDGKFEEISTFPSLNLKWSNYPHDKPVIFLDGLSPKMEAFCDVVSFVDPACPLIDRPPGSAPNTTVGELQLEAATPERRLNPGAYKLTLRIAAANVEPIDKVLEFEHKGPWMQNDDEMRRDCLAVSLR